MRRVLGVLGVPALLLLSLLHTAEAKNTSSITDPLQRVMLRFNLYQVREGMDEKYFSGSQKIFVAPQDEVSHLMKQLEERGQTIHWLKSIFSPRRTLLIIDMQVRGYLLCIYSVSTVYLQNNYNYIYIQNDFVSGSLAVPGAEDILDMVEDLSKLDIWYQVFYTQ